MDNIDRTVDVWSARQRRQHQSTAEEDAEYRSNYLQAMMTRWRLWYEIQKRALKEFNRVVLNDPVKYGSKLPGNLRRELAERLRRTRLEFERELREGN